MGQVERGEFRSCQEEIEERMTALNYWYFVGP